MPQVRPSRDAAPSRAPARRAPPLLAWLLAAVVSAGLWLLIVRLTVAAF